MNLRGSNAQEIDRRQFLCALSAFQFVPYSTAAGDTIHQTVVTAVFVSGVEAYVEAISGLREGLARIAVGLVLVDLRSPQGGAELTEALRSGSQRVVVAIGAEALAAVAARSTDALVVSTMILRSDRPRTFSTAPAAPRPPAVYLDVPLASLLGELKTVLPGKNRCGLIHDSARDESDPYFPARVRQQGFTLETADCSRPEDLVKSFLSLKGKTDFVVLLPDSSLYNNTTVRPLILASLESRLPLVGFSSSFVRAGAALGIYPDFRDVGAQTADMVQKLLAGKSGLADESPRKLQVAVNQRVLRLLGLNCNETPGLVIFR